MAYILTPLTDLDSLNTGGSYAADAYDSAEINIDPIAKTFAFKAGGNLAAAGSGATGQCLYSLFKYLWKNVAELPQYDFPMVSITNEQFEFVQGWKPANDTTRKMIRTAGWAEVEPDGNVSRKYAGIITLGSFVDNTDQPYFAQDSSYTAVTTNTDYTGPVNEAVQILGTTSHGDASAGDFDYTNYFNIYIRERGKIYADANLQDIGVTTMTTIVYRFPLANSNDLKLETSNDTEIDSDNTVPADVSPYDHIDVKYINAKIRGAYSDATVYAANDVVQDVGDSMGNGADRWYITAAGGTSSGASVNADAGVTDWALYSGEREVEAGVWSAYTVLIDAENTIANGTSPYTNGSGGMKENVYDWAQWALRLNTAIDVDTSRNGNVASSLVEFVGDTLHTKPGVFIDTLNSADANKVVFHDYNDTSHTYPLTVTVTLNFNSYLSNDSDSVFYAYYADPNGSADGNEFGTSGALKLKDATGAEVGSDIANNIPDGASGSSYNFSYAYDQDTTGGRSVSTDTPIVVVAIGLNTGQYVKATGTITNSGAVISMVAPLERNYSNPV